MFIDSKHAAAKGKIYRVIGVVCAVIRVQIGVRARVIFFRLKLVYKRKKGHTLANRWRIWSELIFASCV